MALKFPIFSVLELGAASLAPAGYPIIWEHLGMLHRETYRKNWEEKHKFYEANGLVEGETLYTTRDDERGAISSDDIKSTIEQIKITI